MLYDVLESATGDVLSTLEFNDEPDEVILQTLVERGLLEGNADDFTLDLNYNFSDGAMVVLDQRNEPVITLEAQVDEDDDWDDDDEPEIDDPDEDDEED